MGELRAPVFALLIQVLLGETGLPVPRLFVAGGADLEDAMQSGVVRGMTDPEKDVPVGSSPHRRAHDAPAAVVRRWRGHGALAPEKPTEASTTATTNSTVAARQAAGSAAGGILCRRGG